MSLYTPTKLDISTDQHEKLTTAAQHGKAVSLKVNLATAAGQHTFLLTHPQHKRLERARLMGQATVTIKLSGKQVKANVEHSGGFLGALLGLAARVLPTLLGGLATGLISGGIEKAVSGRGLFLHSAKRRHGHGGDGIYLNKSGHCVKVVPIKGRGLQLTPAKKQVHGIFGDGLFVKDGSKVYDGHGLLLGPNSPFKNIPILNLLL